MISLHLETIAAHYPDLQITSAEFNRDGQYNHVLIVNRELVFRFARVQDAIDTLRQEVSVLRAIQARISVPIPNPIYTNFEPAEIGQVFMGYRMLPGRPLWRPAFAEITDAAVRERLAAGLAGFLRELHHTPAAELPEMPEEDDPQSWVEMYQKIQDKLYPQMRPEARREVSAHFESYFNDPNLAEYTPCLRHGDFGTGNLLFDPHRGALAGVIDFGHVGLGDPASDFAGLYTSFGEDFYRLCTPVYPQMEAALARVKFIRGTFALQEALFGLENNDREAYAAGMEKYV